MLLSSEIFSLSITAAFISNDQVLAARSPATMLSTLKNPKLIALISAVTVSGVLGVQFALAALNPSVSSVPQKNVNYGVSRLNAQLNLTSDTPSITVYVNSTQGPIFLDELQITDTAPGSNSGTESLLTGITVNGMLQWPVGFKNVIVSQCSFNACYGEMISAIQSSGISTASMNVLVKDPLGNNAIGASTGSHQAQSMQIPLYGYQFNYMRGSVLSVSAQVEAPSSGKVTLSVTEP